MEFPPAGAKTTRRAKPKATVHKIDKAEKKIKVGLCLSEEAARLLGLHALMTKANQSDIVDGLVKQSFKGYIVSWRPPGQEAPGPLAPTQDVSVGQA